MDDLKTKSEAATGCEASAVERFVIPFGSKVNITHKYRRKIIGRKKEYVPMDFKASGIFLGWRTITNGYTQSDYEDGFYWTAEKYIKAALVSFSATQNPVYVPTDCIEV